MPHISFSELKIWAECPFKHKLMYIDKIKGFIGNEYTAFGGAIHSLCENALLGKLPQDDYEEYFQHVFREELKKVPVSKPKLVMEMLSQANRISPEVIPAVQEYFGNFQVVSVEERLFEKIENFEHAEYNFKGFIDFVVKTDDGRMVNVGQLFVKRDGKTVPASQVITDANADWSDYKGRFYYSQGKGNQLIAGWMGRTGNT